MFRLSQRPLSRGFRHLWLRTYLTRSAILGPSLVAHIIISHLHVPPDEILDDLFRRISDDRDVSVVDQLAYACWWIVNGETLLLAEDKTVGCLAAPDREQLETLIALPHLSDYARKTLAECQPLGAQQ